MNKKSVIDSSSVVLVSGGARGITARCAVRLAEHSRARFILVGRTANGKPEPAWAQGIEDEAELKRRIMTDLQGRGEKPTPQAVQRLFKEIIAHREIEHTLHAIHLAGGQAEYVSADVADASELQKKLEEPQRRFGKITGIIHGAGSLADKLIEKKTEKDFETVFSPKVDGLESLLKCAPASQLDFLVLFSSIVGVFGNAGQADYAIANEILNKSAYMIKRRNPSCQVISIDWGPWDGGMVTPEIKKAFSERGVEIIPQDVGADILVSELEHASPDVVQVVIGSQPARPAEHIGTELRTYQIRRSLRLEDNPFLYDHMIGDHPVLPATCAATWAGTTCEQLYPGYYFYKLENLRVLKGIVFDETLADEYVLDLKETAKDPASGTIEFSALVWSQNPKGRPFYHYTINITLKRDMPSAPVYALPAAAAAEAGQSGDELYHNGTLFHGPSFQGVEQVLHVSRGKLLVRGILPQVDPRKQGQFPVRTGNPYIYDAVVQCLLIWAQYFYQAPCLPARLGKLEQFRNVPFGVPFYVNMNIVSQSETHVVGDIIVQDEQGEAYIRMSGVEGTISKELNRFIGVK